MEAVAVRAIAGFLGRTVAKGCMTIACPDGRELQFGDPDVPETGDGDGTSSGVGRKIAIRVFDWWFFVRVAMEYDLGLARCVCVVGGDSFTFVACHAYDTYDILVPILERFLIL